MAEPEIKQNIVEIGRRMYDRGLIAATDGNISARAADGAVWTTPAGVCKGFLTADMLVKTDLAGAVLAGERRPSSELAMHLRGDQENPAALAVVHGHPPVATAFAVLGRALERPILPEVLLTLGPVPVAPYAAPGTAGVPESIAPFCRTHNAVLLANHGAVTWGGDLWQAYFRLEKLEHYATVLRYTESLAGEPRELTSAQAAELWARRN
jgi:L-fuculose-phosphate aldolase